MKTLRLFLKRLRRRWRGAYQTELKYQRRILEMAIRDADLFHLPETEISMLDAAQASTVYLLTRLCYDGKSNIAELGAYLGGTTGIFGDALKRMHVRGKRLEVYDLFEHNSASRNRLKGHPLYEEAGFYKIWKYNTQAYLPFVELHKGDLREEAWKSNKKLGIIYVDIVKHGSVIVPVMQAMMPRLKVGGLLIHQDYFHWQSPWVVYSTERLMKYFDIVGTVSNHMMVLRLRTAIPPELLRVDDLKDISASEKVSLMRIAIQRYPGLRAGLLRVSLLNLMSDDPSFDFELEASSIRLDIVGQKGLARVTRYLDEVIRIRSIEEKNQCTW